MGDVISSHLDEGKREIITARTGEVMKDFGCQYELQYAVALFNKVRFDIEGGGGPTPQLLHRKAAPENKSIFSGALFQYLEENKKWRNRFFFVPDSYNINYYDNKSSHDRGLHPKGTINCAGYKVLTSMEQYLDLISNSLPGVKAKVGNSPFLKCATQFPLVLWHPYARHYFFCVVSEKEQQKWQAVLQDCVRHANDGLSEESKVQTPAFTDAVRLYRQARGMYGTWDMMCGTTAQILSNLVMENLLSELRDLIAPRLKGKMNERQRNWMLISDAVYGLVQRQCQTQYEAVVQSCETGRPLLEASIRTDMDQIITSKEHVTNKIRAAVLPKAEKLLKVSIEPYITSILDALMEPTSRGFAEVREVFFSELVDMSKNTLNEGTKETVAEHMEKISMLAFHPVKMQSCYEKVEQLSLDGLQQRFDVSSPSVFVQRAQILMREQMDDAVYTFEQILHQSLEAQGTEGLCKVIQRCQDRVIKKFDYDSSTVRKRFFREALLQIFIPYMLKQLTPSCASDLPRFQELIFEDFSRFILVENIFEEVVLHSVMKDISLAVKEAAVQRKHNLYRDSIVLNNSDPNLHLLGEKPSVDWTGEYGSKEEEEEEEVEGAGQEDDADEEGAEAKRRTRMKQVVSMIQVEGSPVLNVSCLEVPGVEGILEEEADEDTCSKSTADSREAKPLGGQNGIAQSPKATPEQPTALTNGPGPKEGDASPEIAIEEPSSLATESLPRDPGGPTAVQSSIQEIDNAVQGEEDSQPAMAAEGATKEQIPTPSNEAVTASEVVPNTEVAATSEVTTSDVAPNTEVAATSEVTTSDVAPNTEVAATLEVTLNKETAATADVSPSKEVAATSDVSSNDKVAATSEVAPDCKVAATSDVSSNDEVPATSSEVAPASEEAATSEVASPLPSSAEQLESTSSTTATATDTEQAPASPLEESAPEAAPAEVAAVATTADLLPPPPPHDDSGFQSPTSEEEGDVVPPPPPSTEAPHTEEGDVVPPPPPPSTEAPHAEEGDVVPPPPPSTEAPHAEEGDVVPPPPPSTEAPHAEEGQPEEGTTTTTTTVARAASEAAVKPSDSETGEEDLSKAVMANEN